MKKLIGLVVLIAALILGSYYGMGIVTERTLKKSIDVINQSNGLFVDVASFDKGWFKSTTVLNWRMHVPEHLVKNQNGQSTTFPAQDYKVKMPLTIYHGPFILAGHGVQFGLGYASTVIDLPAVYADKFSSVFAKESQRPKLVLKLLVNYLNNSTLYVGLPSFKLVAKNNGGQMDWYGMDGKISLSSNLRNIDGSMIINGLNFVKDKSKAILGKVTSSYKMQQTDFGLYSGQLSFALPSFVASENGQNVLEMVLLDIQANTDVDAGLFHSFFKTSLDKLITKGQSYGPVVFEMALKNIDAEILGKMNQQVNEIQQGSNSNRQKALFALLPELPKLFSKGPQFEISKLRVVVPEGVVEGDMVISLPKGEGINPFQLVQKIQGQGKLSVPAALVKSLAMASIKQKLLSQPTLQQAMVQQLQSNDPTQGEADQSKPTTAEDLAQQANAQTEQKLSDMVQSGLIVAHGTNYLVEFSLLQGQLSVNGRPFDASMIQF
jgi:uncharacterized protein YdgA (DUF945 family)